MRLNKNKSQVHETNRSIFSLSSFKKTHLIAQLKKNYKSHKQLEKDVSPLGALAMSHLGALLVMTLAVVIDIGRFGYYLWGKYFAASAKQNIGDDFSQFLMNFDTIGGSIEYIARSLLYLGQSALTWYVVLLFFGLAVLFIADQVKAKWYMRRNSQRRR